MKLSKPIGFPKDDEPSLSDIVDKLVANTYQILQWKFIFATNRMLEDEDEAVKAGLPRGYVNFDHTKLEQIVSMVEPLLKDAQATRKIEAQSSKDIIKLISQGKISLDEAIKLMSLMKIKLEVDEREIKNQLQKEVIKLMRS
ncbi:MAG: hypothetical protein DRO88_02585 [Promethearchaeia archaeon]|nr:MAG: hypothetical protein DRO88_02585 [Candidatus Lokiarchaeia archaeon]